MFDRSNLEADKTAFARLMKHLKEVDHNHGTVLMVQVENEVGLLGSSRDHSKSSQETFSRAVPSKVIEQLTTDFDSLNPTLQHSLAHFRSRSSPSGPWAETFGTSAKADEIFMAYHYAIYVDEIAFAGKAMYALPMFVNAALSAIDMDPDIKLPEFMMAAGGEVPGGYPSGGPTIDVLDIWQLFAPSIDFISPDIYIQDYSKILKHYRHRDQPLMIPEQRRDEHGLRRIWAAYGSHGALCASPFGIDSFPADDLHILKEHLGLIATMQRYLLDIQADASKGFGFYFDELKEGENFASNPKKVRLGDWELTITRGFSFGPCRPGYGLIYRLTGNSFLLAGAGYAVEFESVSRSAIYTGIAHVREVDIPDPSTGELRTIRWLNGDETGGGTAARMPNLVPPQSTFPIPLDTAGTTRLAVCEVYHLEG